jgi:redox-sensitive bicupin YhaK (pirin superfamily)
MITLRKSHERGHAQHGWLDSRHTFSFAGYHDPEHMGFRDLRVINEDRVEPARGFGTHAHRDMEILSYVLSGELAHRDSLGNGSVIRPGDVQRMSAGTGVTHSELNPSQHEPVHFLQIWILPEQDGLPPSYEQRHFPAEERAGRLRLVASRDARDGALRVHQDVEVHAGLLGRGAAVTHALRPGRHAWLQLARGRCAVNGVALEAGDGAAVSGETQLRIDAADDAELLLFDLA